MINLSIDWNVRCRNEKVTDELKALVERSLKAALEYEEVEGDCEISVTFVSDRIIRQMNREFRGIDKATDVLSFPMAEDGDLEDAFDGEKYQLGDVVLSLEHARAQAELYGHSFEREVAFLCVHSALHLLGYDHETGEEDENDMRARQRAIMKVLGLEVSNSEIK